VKRRALALLVTIGLAAAPLMFVAGDANAQSPSPNAYFLDWPPGNDTSTTNGLETLGLGAGLGGCSYSYASIIDQTVYDIDRGQATITEISPQSYCGSLTAYEDQIAGIVIVVEEEADSNVGHLWGGILLDEEPGFDFSVSQLLSLNAYVDSLMLGTPGITWFYVDQGNCSGCWTQAQYDSLTDSSGVYGIPAPQVYNSFQAAEANNSGFNYQLVYCWPGATYPYDAGCGYGFYPYGNGSYAAASIAGTPYDQQFGTDIPFNWENVFQS
jgi:hypothetical protein